MVAEENQKIETSQKRKTLGTPWTIKVQDTA